MGTGSRLAVPIQISLEEEKLAVKFNIQFCFTDDQHLDMLRFLREPTFQRPNRAVLLSDA
jgi:hypothetical protein